MIEPLLTETQTTLHFLGNSKILIVEDERLLALGMEELLREYGVCQIQLESSVQVARNIVQENNDITAIVLDLKLGDGCGSELFDVIAAKRIPTIVVTGYTDFHCGGLPKILKPFSSEVFLSTLAQAIYATKDH